MFVKEVLAVAAATAGRSDLATEIEKESPDVDAEILRLVRCYNLVENEIALDYFPLKHEETVTALDGIIPYSQLEFAPVTVFTVTGIGGDPLNFETRPAHILLSGMKGQRQMILSYSYSPKEKLITEDASFGEKISARLLAFGVACEFCLSNGQYAEAATWEKKYREALRAANVSRRRLSVRSRRWV